MIGFNGFDQFTEDINYVLTQLFNYMHWFSSGS